MRCTLRASLAAIVLLVPLAIVGACATASAPTPAPLANYSEKDAPQPGADEAAAPAILLGHPSPDPENIARLPLPPGALRASITDGTSITMRIQEAGKPAQLEVTHFILPDETGCLLSVRRMSLIDGQVISTDRVRVAWVDLEKHAHFPREATTIAATALTTRMGELETLQYEVRGTVDGKATITRMWFAPSLPGPPVRFEREVDGEVVMTSTMEQTSRP